MINVVIVEDQKILREGLKALLRDAKNIHVTGDFGDPKELLTSIDLVPIDVALIDVRLPYMSGQELTKLLSKTYPQIKSLGISVIGDQKTCSNMLNAGAKGFLPKDISSDELVFAIEKISKGESYIHPKVSMSSHKAVKAIPVNFDYSIYLTKRELEVLEMVAAGLTNSEIAANLAINKRTVETHRMNLLKKTQTKNTAALIKYALDNELI